MVRILICSQDNGMGWQLYLLGSESCEEKINVNLFPEKISPSCSGVVYILIGYKVICMDNNG